MKGILSLILKSKKTILYRFFLLSLFIFIFYYIESNTIFGFHDDLEYYSFNAVFDFKYWVSMIQHNINAFEEYNLFPIALLTLFGLFFSPIFILFISISSLLDISFIVINYGKNLDFFKNNSVKIESKYLDDLNKVKTGDILKYSESLKNLNHIRKKIKEMKIEDDDFFLTKNEIKLKTSRDELRDYENIYHKITQYTDKEYGKEISK